MRRTVAGILEGYGTRLYLEHKGRAEEVRGFLQPVRSKDQQQREHRLQEAGEYPAGQYVYIGPPGAEQGDVIYRQGKRFALRRAETVFVGDSPVYCWGLCVEEKEEPWTALSQT